MKPAKRKQRKSKDSPVAVSRRRQSRDLATRLEEFYRPVKRSVTLRLDADVLDWFKKQGKGYQTRINRALRDFMIRNHKSGL